MLNTKVFFFLKIRKENVTQEMTWIFSVIISDIEILLNEVCEIMFLVVQEEGFFLYCCLSGIRIINIYLFMYIFVLK